MLTLCNKPSQTEWLKRSLLISSQFCGSEAWWCLCRVSCTEARVLAGQGSPIEAGRASPPQAHLGCWQSLVLVTVDLWSRVLAGSQLLKMPSFLSTRGPCALSVQPPLPLAAEEAHPFSLTSWPHLHLRSPSQEYLVFDWETRTETLILVQAISGQIGIRAHRRPESERTTGHPSQVLVCLFLFSPFDGDRGHVKHCCCQFKSKTVLWG